MSPEHKERLYRILCQVFTIFGNTPPESRSKLWPLIADLLELIGPDYFRLMLEADHTAAKEFLRND